MSDDPTSPVLTIPAKTHIAGGTSIETGSTVPESGFHKAMFHSAQLRYAEEITMSQTSDIKLLCWNRLRESLRRELKDPPGGVVRPEVRIIAPIATIPHEINRAYWFSHITGNAAPTMIANRNPATDQNLCMEILRFCLRGTSAESDAKKWLRGSHLLSRLKLGSGCGNLSR